MNPLSTLFQSRRWKPFAPIAVPVIVIIALIMGVASTLAVLNNSINLQIESGTTILNYNISDQSRIFVQLQRETLKLINILVNDAESQNRDALDLQYQLLASRINHMEISVLENVAPTDIVANARSIIGAWNGIYPSIDALLVDLNNDALRADLVSQLRDFELMANSTEIEYARARTVTLSDFADASRQIPATFTSVIVTMLAVMATVLLGLYVYIRQIQRAEAARQSNLFKDQFLAVMSHELRTPLNAMIGFLGIIKMGGGLTEKTAYMIDRVRDNAERLLTLINDILDLSKIEANRFEIHNELVPIKDLAAIWKAQNDVLATEKGLKFSVEVDPNFPDVIYTDSDALTKIVVNLLSNAFKFTKAGEVDLAIRKVDASMELRVTDTGIGIAEDKQQLVFESFRQVDSSTRRSYGGTGLGLTIVRSLTHLMKGTITLKSQPGVGSTFTVTLPLQPIPQEKASLNNPTPNPAFSK